jgi:VanZ family protein
LPRTSVKAILLYWGPALVMLLCIAMESTDMLSAGHTGGMILPLLQKLFPNASLDSLEIVHAGIRKLGHVVGYGLLSLSLFRAWAGTRAMQQGDHLRWQMQFSLFAILGTASVAIADELHQMTIPSRGGSVHDMVLDTSAAILAQLIIAYFLTHRAGTPTSASAE